MPFITSYNIKRISSKIQVEDLPSNYTDLFGKVWKKDIWFFNAREKAKLLLMKTFYRNPVEVVDIYVQSDKEDTFTYVHEAKNSFYHYSQNCSQLHSSFTTHKVPAFIKAKKNHREVISFREWYKLNIHLFEGRRDIFYQNMEKVFGQWEELEDIDAKNMGFEELENIPVLELEERINYVLFKASQFYVRKTDIEQKVMRKYCRNSSLAYTKTLLDDNDSRMSDSDIINLLMEYDKTFKEPLKSYLNIYYRILFNPNLEFKESLLESLNFKCCSMCKGLATPS